MSYELHKESIGPTVWDDIEGLKSYKEDLKSDMSLCDGKLESDARWIEEYRAMIHDVDMRIKELMSYDQPGSKRIPVIC